MMFLRNYLQVLLPLVVAFTAYQVLAVPMLEPTKIATKTQSWQSQGVPKGADWWDSLFPPNAWQRNSCRTVKTETAILLFQTSEQKTDTRWLVKPLTILIPQRDEGGSKRAIVINNSEGAEIQFKSKVDWTKELPPLESGQMLGNIVIESPPDDPLKNNGMRIETQRLQIDKRQIWTDRSIKMTLGNSLVEGRNLSIHLDKDLLTEEQPGAKQESPFNGLDTLELFYVDRVQVGLNPGGLWPNKDIPDMSSRLAYATLKCGGAFVFDFHRSLAIFKNDVHMEHIVQGLPLDTFDCHELKLRVGFEDKVAQTPKSPGNASNSNWSIEQIDAIGAVGRDSKDHSRWLKLHAPGVQAEAQGQHLVMDLINGEVSLSNNLPGNLSRESSYAYLRRESVQIWAAEIQYRNAALSKAADSSLGAKNAPSDKRLGAMLASGAGRAQMDNRGESWVLSWGKRLFIRPDGDKDLVMIEGSANFYNPTQGRFIAEQLHLWLTPMTPTVATQVSHHFPDGKLPFALPDRMEADGDVYVDSRQLKAKVANMKVWFAYPPPQPVAAPVPSSQLADSKPNLLLGAPSGPPVAPLVQPAPKRPGPASPNHLTATPASPLNVTAREMRAKVVSLGSEVRIDELNLEGTFTLTKEQLSDASPWPFTANGDTLTLSQGVAETTDITIVGQPAKVAVGSGWVLAPELVLKQSSNQFWIDHPGEMVIPVEALRQNNSTKSPNALVSLPSNPFGNTPLGTNNYNRNQLKDNAIRWRDPPRLQWGQRMTFDGRTARFGGGIAIDCRMETDMATLWHLNARADQMSIDMEQPIELKSNGSSAKTSAAQAQIAMIRLEDHVEIRAVQTDLKMNRRSTEHLKLPQLDIFVPSQTWLGHGPGEIWSRRLGNASSPIAVGKPGNSDDAAKQCIHMSFIGRMEGAIAQSTVSFYDQIQALLGPIVNWDDSVDVFKVDDVRNLGRNQTFLLSDQLNFFDASVLSHNTKSNAWNVSATSRVRLDSNTDQGLLSVTADSLKYATDSDVVRIESANQPATIKRTQPNSPTSDIDLAVSTAAMRLKTGEVEGRIKELRAAVPNRTQPSPGLGPKSQPPASLRDAPLIDPKRK